MRSDACSPWLTSGESEFVPPTCLQEVHGWEKLRPCADWTFKRVANALIPPLLPGCKADGTWLCDLFSSAKCVPCTSPVTRKGT